MSYRLALLALTGIAATLGACAPMAPMSPGAPYGAPPPSAAFNAADFGWSARGGQASIDGRVDFRRDGQAYECTGSVGLTPDTPYTRARINTLYGSTDQAALPEAVVRARTVSDPNADYRAFVRSSTCDGNHFRFTGLPDGSWFVIAPVSAGGDRVVLMRHVQTQGGRRATLTL